MQNLNLNKLNLVKNIYYNKNIIIIFILKLNLFSVFEKDEITPIYKEIMTKLRQNNKYSNQIKIFYINNWHMAEP